jgi:hypothetical protein
MMLLLYIFFITIFLPQLNFVDGVKTALPIEAKSTDQKIIQGISYHDGTILLRLVKMINKNNEQSNEQSDCTKKDLSFIKIPYESDPYLNIKDHSIPQINFCSVPIVNSFPTINSPCDYNPYGYGCKVACDDDSSQLPAVCEQLPDCRNNGTGCNNTELDCTIYPTAPNCTQYIQFPDCAKYPGANKCTVDCYNRPYLPGCNECSNNPGALGCRDCEKDQSNKRCRSGYCVANPDAPECSLIKMDKVKIYAVEDNKTGDKFILVTFYCDPSNNDDDCGILYNIQGVQIKYVKINIHIIYCI